MDLEKIERLANDLAFGRTRYSFDHSKLGCDLLKMIECLKAAKNQLKYLSEHKYPSTIELNEALSQFDFGDSVGGDCE